MVGWLVLTVYVTSIFFTYKALLDVCTQFKAISPELFPVNVYSVFVLLIFCESPKSEPPTVTCKLASTEEAPEVDTLIDEITPGIFGSF